MLTKYIQKLINKQDLTFDEMSFCITNILAENDLPESQVAALLAVLSAKGESLAEILATVDILKQRAIATKTIGSDHIDTCGTGGSGIKSFNISTIAAFVAAATGVKIAKHGNRSASSNCGSADFLEGLGVKLDISPEEESRALNEINLAFLFAPNHHKILKNIAKIRRELGIRTIFNFVGPLANPAQAKRQLIGVSRADLPKLFAETLKKMGSKQAMVVHASDGMDEITVTGKTNICELRDGNITNHEFDPKRYIGKYHPLAAVEGGDLATNIKICHDILAGEVGAKRDIVLLNAAAAIIVAGKVKNFDTAFDLARHAIDSGNAKLKLDQLINFQGGR